MAERKTLVWADYDRLLRGNNDDPDETKRFATRQGALKSALSHIDMLTKMGGDPNPSPPENSNAMLAHARAALAEENADDERELED